jgi:hypothetical protein
MEASRYRGHRRYEGGSLWSRPRVWQLAGFGAVAVALVAALIAGTWQIGTGAGPATAQPGGVPRPPGPAAPDDPSDGASSSPSAHPSSPGPSGSRSPSPSASASASAEFSVALSVSSGPVTAGSQVRFTVTTTIVSGTPGPLTLAVAGLPDAATASFSPNAIAAGAATQATIATTAGTPAGTYPVVVSASAKAIRHSTTFTLTVNGAQVLLNGGFESGLSNWSTGGSVTSVGSPVHGGSTAVRVGSTNPSGDSTIRQTVTVTGNGQLSLWYRMVCDDRISFDWFDVSATDLTTNQTTTVVRKTCHTSGSYEQASATLTTGHQYQIVVENRDDNHANDASYTYVDDVSLT